MTPMPTHAGATCRLRHLTQTRSPPASNPSTAAPAPPTNPPAQHPPASQRPPPRLTSPGSSRPLQHPDRRPKHRTATPR